MLLFFSKLKALLEYKNVLTTVFFNFTIQIYAKIPSLLLSIFEVGRLQNQSIYFLTKYKEWKMFIVVVCLFFLFRFSFSFLLFFFCLLLCQAIFRWLASILRFFVFKKSNVQYLKKKLKFKLLGKKFMSK